MKLHKYMLSVTWEWFQLILGSKTQIKENIYEEFDICYHRKGGGGAGGNLSHKYSSSFIFW